MTTVNDQNLIQADILIVDDEHTLRKALVKWFSRLGHRVAEAASGTKALERIKQQQFDLVLLDLNLPGMNGSQVLQAARPLAPETVFIIFTAYGTLDSAIVAIRNGAFDYILKPSSVHDIARAVEAGLAERQRRLRQQDPVVLLEQALSVLKTPAPESPAAAPRFLQGPDVTIDLMRHLVVRRGQPVELTVTEFEILVYLLRHQDRVISCRELVAHVRGYEMDERDARLLLRSHIHRLRRKLETDPAYPQLLRTVRGQDPAPGRLCFSRPEKR